MVENKKQAFLGDLGTIRECIDCGCLIASSSDRCKRCDSFDKGHMNCIQDRCENVPFDSVGGLEKRLAMEPKYAPKEPVLRNEYLSGYCSTAAAMFGPDWATCEFGWVPTLTLGRDE